MIDSKIKFFSPIHINYKINLMMSVLVLSIFLVILFLEMTITQKFYGVLLILNYIIMCKIYDLYDILGKKKNKLEDFKMWLNFIKTNQYKNLMGLIYVYYTSFIISIIGGFTYFFITSSNIDKTFGIILICSLLLHLTGTYLKFKKIQT